ncbi:hypothetical protein, partial [uncultured Salinisphaera sp.]|uniref:hypothetical protein n=1 Tax=uncultured Salinisphaera sp. TaxID=359372 RepID=UPI0032B27E27
RQLPQGVPQRRVREPQPAEVEQLVDAARRKARRRREDAEHILGANLQNALTHAVDIGAELVALQKQMLTTLDPKARVDEIDEAAWNGEII